SPYLNPMSVLHKIPDFQGDAQAAGAFRGQDEPVNRAVRGFLPVFADGAHLPKIHPFRDGQHNLVAGHGLIEDYGSTIEKLVVGKAYMVATDVLHLAPGEGYALFTRGERNLRRSRVDQDRGQNHLAFNDLSLGGNGSFLAVSQFDAFSATVNLHRA